MDTMDMCSPFQMLDRVVCTDIFSMHAFHLNVIQKEVKHKQEIDLQ